MDRHLNSCQDSYSLSLQTWGWALQPHSWATGPGGGYLHHCQQASALSTQLLSGFYPEPPESPKDQNNAPHVTRASRHSAHHRMTLKCLLVTCRPEKMANPSICSPHSSPCKNLLNKYSDCTPGERVCSTSSCNPKSWSGISELGLRWKNQGRAESWGDLLAPLSYTSCAGPSRLGKGAGCGWEWLRARPSGFSTF